MRTSHNWFQGKSEQNTFSRLAELPTMVLSGPGMGAHRPREKNKDDNGFFVVGKTEIGGEEVVG